MADTSFRFQYITSWNSSFPIHADLLHRWHQHHPNNICGRQPAGLLDFSCQNLSQLETCHCFNNRSSDLQKRLMQVPSSSPARLRWLDAPALTRHALLPAAPSGGCSDCGRHPGPLEPVARPGTPAAQLHSAPPLDLPGSPRTRPNRPGQAWRRTANRASLGMSTSPAECSRQCNAPNRTGCTPESRQASGASPRRSPSSSPQAPQGHHHCHRDTTTATTTSPSNTSPIIIARLCIKINFIQLRAPVAAPAKPAGPQRLPAQACSPCAGAPPQPTSLPPLTPGSPHLPSSPNPHGSPTQSCHPSHF